MSKYNHLVLGVCWNVQFFQIVGFKFAQSADPMEKFIIEQSVQPFSGRGPLKWNISWRGSRREMRLSLGPQHQYF